MKSLLLLQSFNAWTLLDTLLCFTTAFVLGAAIGFERQVRQRTAGLRTNTLVAVGAAIFVSLGDRLYELHGGGQGAVHVVAYVVSGIGFLGAGAIMKEGANVTGLNTAATLWGSGAVGACAGAGLLAEAFLAALFVLASNTLLLYNNVLALPLMAALLLLATNEAAEVVRFPKVGVISGVLGGLAGVRKVLQSVGFVLCACGRMLLLPGCSIDCS